MKKFKIPLLMMLSFLFGALTVWLIVHVTVQSVYNRAALLDDSQKALTLDEGAISEDTKVINALSVCLMDMKSCDMGKITQLAKEYKQERVTMTSEQNTLKKQIQLLPR